MAFEIDQKVMFKHCDPAGIVFFSRYYEIINDCVECFFDTAVGRPFEELHKVAAVPTVEMNTQFVAPSRHGDLLHLRLQVLQVGRTSLGYDLRATCDEQLRFVTKATLVQVDVEGQPKPWDEELRQALSKLIKGAA